MSKKIPLILGKGYIGSNVSSFFDKTNLDHIIFNKSALDYTNPSVLEPYLKENKEKISYIVNCFGYTGSPNVDGCEKNRKDCWSWNVLYPLKVLEIANDLKIPVVHVGSGCVYTNYDKNYTEEDEPNFGLYSDQSSFYSRCKHEFEILAQDACVYILRIRIPFCSEVLPKNYLVKLLKYDRLIDNLNSVTSVNDFCGFMFKFNVLIKELNGGIYNVVNPQPIKTEQTVELLRKYGLDNPKWEFIKDYQLDTIAKRSNCVLSTERIDSFSLTLPDTLESLEKAIKLFAVNYEMVQKR